MYGFVMSENEQPEGDAMPEEWPEEDPDVEGVELDLDPDK